MFTADGRGVGINLEIGIVPMTIIAILFLAWWTWVRRNFWRAGEVEINLFGQKVKIKPNYEVARIAHKAWTELRSRKAAIEFDAENDVITEVYDSWYALFGEIRSLVKEIPAEEIRNNGEVRKLVGLLMGTLNRGLRPHLTKYQARFRRWLDAEIKRIEEDGKKLHADAESAPVLSLQEIQRRYPDYDNLTEHLLQVNRFLIDYSKALEIIAHGQEFDNQEVVIREPEDPTDTQSTA